MLTKEQVLEKIEKGESFEGAEIGDVDFGKHPFSTLVDFSGAIFTSRVIFDKARFLNGVLFTGAQFKAEASFKKTLFDSETDPDERWRQITESDEPSRHVELDPTDRKLLFNKPVSFFQTKFLDKVTFEKAKFRCEVDFWQANFEGDTVFRQTEFSRRASFSAHFHKFAAFDSTKFSAVDFSNAHFDERADFHLAQFQDEADFKFIKASEIFFNEAKFYKGASFDSAKVQVYANFASTQFSDVFFFDIRFYGKAYFDRAKFQKEAIFHLARLQGEIVFDSAEFQKEVDFSEAQFSGKTYFNNMQLNDGANFLRAQFENVTHFMVAQCKGEVNFGGTQFKGEVHFRSTQFKGDVRFSEVKFEDKAYFVDVQFEGLARFWKAQFKHEAHFAGAQFHKYCVFMGEKEIRIFSNIHRANLIGVKFQKPDQVIFQTVDLSMCSFIETDLSKVELTDIIFPVEKGLLGTRRVVYDEIADKSKDIDYPLIEKLYRDLKKNYENRGSYGEAGDFHYGEMEMRRLSQNKFFRVVSFLWLYKILSGYGEKHWRAIFWLSAFLLVYLGAYRFIEYNALPFRDGLWNSLIHTLQVITFQADRLYYPKTDWGTLSDAGLKIFIPLQAALTILAIKRKFKR